MREKEKKIRYASRSLILTKKKKKFEEKNLFVHNHVLKNESLNIRQLSKNIIGMKIVTYIGV